MEDLNYTDILKLNKELAGDANNLSYSVGILSNVTVNTFKDILEYGLRLNQIEPSVELGNFDNIVQDSAIFKDKDLIIIFYDMLNVVDNVSAYFESLEPEQFESLKNKIFAEIDIIFENLKSVPSVIFNSFSSAYFVPSYTSQSKLDNLVAEINNYINENRRKNISIINIEKIFLQTGINQSVDFRFYNSSKAPYTVVFFKRYFEAIESVILRNTGKLKKAVIFDCDNTLWKGILGEDGMENLDMAPSSPYGKYFHLVQNIAVFLSKNGVLVGLCSKNNESDIEEVMQNHEGMILKNEYIVAKKINWSDKATNLKAIASELNISLDSLLFIDDSSFEINLIKEQIPEVMVMQVPKNISEYPNLLIKNISKYFNLNVSSEDASRTELYKKQVLRENEKMKATSLKEYLASLEISINISKDDFTSIPRIAQLTQKTNQFNLTTKRYTDTQIEQFMNNEHDYVFSLSVRDKFGDNGLTGVCILKVDPSESGHIFIDTFLLSCRIIGRNIEYAFVNYIIKEFVKKQNLKKISASYVPTKKNVQVETFYDNLGFELIENKDGTKFYSGEIEALQNYNYEYILVSSQ
jgi:FkbH-like protein